ncbi:hypothetical protein L596_013896 [Steinernema carpocapsae]|uniref:TIL domain-containing protein n=1 Tax=Steinernema carpocapsae TaxID=34508 RepID=A0A4V6A579_STECR|nr:hypothetical protein L596_013896 [Steinernema carpocapsae]
MSRFYASSTHENQTVRTKRSAIASIKAEHQTKPASVISTSPAPMASLRLALFVLVVFCAAFQASFAAPAAEIQPKECPQNTVWTSCGHCQGTCRDPKPRFCTTHCRVGCLWNDNYVVNPNGDGCILATECPKN